MCLFLAGECMKDKLKITICLIPFLVLFYLSLGSENYSSEEDKKLEQKPNLTMAELWNGNYAKDYQRYLEDHFPLRTSFRKIATNVEQAFGIKEQNDVYFGKQDQLVEKTEPQTNGKKMIQTLNKAQEKFNYINSSLMLIPSKSSIYKEYLPDHVSSSEVEEMNELYYNLAINDINLVQTLTGKKNDYPLYYRTDFTWTSYGAYYAYLEYCEKNDIESVPMTEYEIKKVSETYYGDLYYKTLDGTIPADTIYQFVKDEPKYQVSYTKKEHEKDTFYQNDYLKQVHKKGFFLGEDDGEITITNPEVHNGKELLIVKDDSGNEIVPFLSQHYEKVYVLNVDEAKNLSDWIKDHEKVTDLLYIATMNHIDQNNAWLEIR